MRQPSQSLANSLIVCTVVLALTIANLGIEAASEHDVNGIHGNDTHETHHKAHGVTVVHLQFEYVEQPLILTVFLVFVVLIKIGWFSATLYYHVTLYYTVYAVIVCLSVCVSVCLSCSDIVSKRLNVELCKQCHMIA